MVVACALLAPATVIAGEAAAQKYPARPIRLLVGLPAGGSTDIVARIVANGLAETLGQNLVVDNRVGRSGIVAGEKLAKATTPDGYTVLFGASFFAEVLATVQGTLPYDPLRDFASVALVAKIPNVLVVYPGLPARSVAELIKHARTRPGALHYASSGNGSSAHLSMEMLKRRTGIDLVHVPYKGAPQALVELAGGQIQAMFGNVPAQISPIRSGKVRALAVTAAERHFQLPEVPTMAEAGVPGFEITVWYGIVAPAGVPASIVRTLNSAVVAAMARPEVKARMLEQGAQPTPGAPEAFTAFRRAETAQWMKLVREAGLKN